MIFSVDDYILFCTFWKYNYKSGSDQATENYVTVIEPNSTVEPVQAGWGMLYADNTSTCQLTLGHSNGFCVHFMLRLFGVLCFFFVFV